MKPVLTVLVVAYYFPPMGGAGVQRALKFVKYFPEFNIRPIVICADELGYVKDSTQVSEHSSSLEVYRIRSEPFIARLRKGANLGGIGTGGREASGLSIKSKFLSKVKSLVLQVYGLVNFPDDKHRWATQAYKRASEILSETDVDVIFSTAPPMSVHKVAKKLKEAHGIPWVADFRDFWLLNPTYSMPWFRRVIDQRYENTILNSADRVVTVTPGMVDQFQQQVALPEKVFLVTNGFDEKDFANCELQPSSEVFFEFLFTGTFYGPTSPRTFLSAMKKLLNEDCEYLDKVRIRFIGNISSGFLPFVAAFKREFPDVIQHISYKPHSEVVGAMMSADALLLVIGGAERSRTIYTGKIFEYLRAGKPILFVGPENGDAWNLISDKQAGLVAAEDDEESILQNIKKLVDGKFHIASDVDAGKYERKILCERLSQILENAAGR